MLSFNTLRGALINGSVGHMPPVNNKRVQLCRLDTESTFKLKALAKMCYYMEIREAFNYL